MAAQNRSTTPAHIISELRGDLNAIISRCLCRDPRRRYDSALTLAQDLERFRRGESVHARPDTPPRRLKRAMSHHPLAVSLALIAILALTASFFNARSQRAMALAAKDRAEIASQGANDATILITELLTEIISKPAVAPRTSADILAEASRLAGLRLNNDPIMEARVRASMGHLWTSQNRNDLAAQEFSRAIELLQSNDQTRLLAETELLLAGSLRADGSFNEARRNADKARREFLSESPADTDDLARAYLELARISAAEGKNSDAVLFLNKAQTALEDAPELNEKLSKKISSLFRTLSTSQSVTPANTSANQ